MLAASFMLPVDFSSQIFQSRDQRCPWLDSATNLMGVREEYKIVRSRTAIFLPGFIYECMDGTKCANADQSCCKDHNGIRGCPSHKPFHCKAQSCPGGMETCCTSTENECTSEDHLGGSMRSADDCPVDCKRENIDKQCEYLGGCGPRNDGSTAACETKNGFVGVCYSSWCIDVQCDKTIPDDCTNKKIDKLSALTASEQTR